MDGGDFSVSGGSTNVIGEGVSIILTKSGSGGSWGNVSINGGNLDLSAPAAGEDMAGVLFYQDRNAPASSQKNSFLGGATMNLDGVIYTPSRGLDFGGNNGSTSETCTKLIAKTVKFHGTPAIGNHCEGNSNIRDIGIPNIKLVQ